MFQKEKLFSSIGGDMGLWAGLSVVALLELLELVFDLAVLALTRKKISPR